MTGPRCILCRRRLALHAAEWWCVDEDCPMWSIMLPEPAAGRLSALLGTYVAKCAQAGRQPRERLYNAKGVRVWRCTCCGLHHFREDMKTDKACSDGVSSWCKACCRDAVAETRERLGRTDR